MTSQPFHRFCRRMLVVLVPLVTLGCHTESKRPNVLLISLDTLRADHLSCYGYHRQTSRFWMRSHHGGCASLMRLLILSRPHPPTPRFFHLNIKRVIGSTSYRSLLLGGSPFQTGSLCSRNPTKASLYHIGRHGRGLHGREIRL